MGNKFALFAVTMGLMLCEVVYAEDFPGDFHLNDRGVMAELVSGLKAADAGVPLPQPAQTQSANNEMLHFWEDLKSDVIDDICKEVRLELSEGATIDNVAGLGGEFNRYLKQYPDKHIALVDEVGVKFDAGYTAEDTLDIAGGTFHVGFSGSLEGKSVVVRKTVETKYCGQLLNMLDLRKVKTILPINERRLAGMNVNEIWKFPAVLRASISGGAGVAVQPWATVSFFLGNLRELKPSVTLFKMDESRLRLRIRLDRVHVKSAGVSVGTTFDAGMIGLQGAEGLLAQELTHAAVKELNRYLGLKLGLTHRRVKGKKLLLEFILDPRDAGQMARLVEFLKGDMSVIKRLIEMGVRFNDFSDMDDNAAGHEALQSIGEVAGEDLGLNPSFSGSDHYSGASTAFNVSLPVVLHGESVTGQRYDRYQTMSGEEVMHVHNASNIVSVGNVNLPSSVFKHNTNQNFYVVNYEDQAGKVSDASMLYRRYEGYVMHDERDAREMVRDMNGILKYAGVRGEGVNNSFAVDDAALFPRLTEAEANPHDNGYGVPVVDFKRYHTAIMSFSLVFTQQAVRDIIAAPALTVMKAALNLLEGLDREMLEKVRHLFRVEEGEVRYDWKAAREILRKYDHAWEGGLSPLGVVDNFCARTAALISDLSGVRSAADPVARSSRMARLLGGKGKSSMGYEKMVQVLVQLVDVKDIYAHMEVKTDKRIDGEDDVASVYYIYNTSLQSNSGAQLDHANELRDRFADPSVLSD